MKKVPKMFGPQNDGSLKFEMSQKLLLFGGSGGPFGKKDQN